MLNNFKKAVASGRACVVWLGGSLTEGEGALAPCFCWQALLGDWLKERFRECDFTFFNRGIGGTNSEFGLYRLKRDVLACRPDLLFVEFAVNDYGRSPEKIREDMEGIIGRTLASGQDTDILIVLNTTVKMAEENYDRGQLPESVRIHLETAQKYGLPVIAVGEAFLRRIKEQGLERRALLPDGVHPNNAGYQMYYHIVREAFEGMLEAEREEGLPEKEKDLVSGAAEEAEAKKNSAEKSPAKKSPAEKSSFEDAEMINALTKEAAGFQLLEAEGFREEGIALCGREQGYISSNVPGSRLKLSFCGTSFGLVWMLGPDSGRIVYSVDGGEEKTASSWDSYAEKRERINHRMLADGLPAGRHSIELWVDDGKDERSLGKFIRICSWLIR